MEPQPPCDIRELRPDETAAALERIGPGPAAQSVVRQLSVGAFNPGDGALHGVAVNETLDPRGCAVHLSCDDPTLGRTLLDRALAKAARAGYRATRVALHPESTARAVWVESAWPARAAGVNPDPAPRPGAPETPPNTPGSDPAADSTAQADQAAAA